MNFFKLLVILASISTSAHAQLVDSCASYTSSVNFIYMPIAKCTQILNGNVGSQYTTLTEADLCIVKTRNVKKKKTYLEISGSYRGTMRGNSILTSGIYADSEDLENSGNIIKMIDGRSVALYSTQNASVKISNLKDNVRATLQCVRLK